MAASITRIRAGALAIAMALVLALAGTAAAGAATRITPGSNPGQLDPSGVIPWGIPGPDPLSGTGATGCTGEMPGARDMFQFLNHWWPRGELMGIYACRDVGTTGSYSLHAEGRAADFHLDVNNAADKDAGVAIRKFFLADDSAGGHWAMARRFGIQEMIWKQAHLDLGAGRRGLARLQRAHGRQPPHRPHPYRPDPPRRHRNTSAWTGFDACRPGQGGCPPI